MAPRRRVRSEPFLTPERRLELLERILARREVRIAVGLPPDVVDPEEEVEEEEEEVVEEEEDDEVEEEEGDEPGEEDVGVAGDGDLWAKQQAIPDSLRSESDAEARRRHRHEMEAQRSCERGGVLGLHG
jgi:hypothetical protein